MEPIQKILIDKVSYLVDRGIHQDPDFRTIELITSETNQKLRLETIYLHEDPIEHGKPQMYPLEIMTIMESKCEYFVEIIPFCDIERSIQFEQPHYFLLRKNYVSYLEMEVESKSLSLRDSLEFMIKIAQGVNHLHTELKILHCDLVLGNILLDQHRQIKINGFHNARYTNSPCRSARLRDGWMAPEVKQSYSNYSVKSEVWCLALVLYQIMEQRSLLEMDIQNIRKGRNSLSLKSNNARIKGILQRMLQRDSSIRPCLKEVISELQKELDVLDGCKLGANIDPELYQQFKKYKNNIYELFPHYIDSKTEPLLAKLKQQYLLLNPSFSNDELIIQRNCIEFARQKIRKKQWLRAWKIIQETELWHLGSIRLPEKQSITMLKAICCDQNEEQVVAEQKKKAIQYFKQCFEILKKISKEFDDKYMFLYTKMGKIFHEQAMEFQKNNQIPQMQQILKEAEDLQLEAQQRLKKEKKSIEVSFYTADIERQRAENYLQMKKNKEAASCINESLSLYRQIFSTESTLKKTEKYSELFHKCVETMLRVLKRYGLKEELSLIRKNCEILFPYNKQLHSFIDTCKQKSN